MRLTHYISESSSTYTELKDFTDEEVELLIKKNCKKFLKESKGKFFIRQLGTIKYNSNYKVHTPTRSRKPVDTRKDIHDLFNDAFQKKFGWKARNGIFVEPVFTSSFSHSFFPIGDYKYVYSDKIKDFLLLLKHIIKLEKKQENSFILI